jgi:hypothetical protein
MNSEIQPSLRGFSLSEASLAIGIATNTLRLHIRRGNARVVRCGKRIIVPGTEVARILREGLPSLSSAKPPTFE